MPLLLIDDVKRTVETVSDEEWRVIRLLRLLSDGGSEDIQSSLCEQVADRLTNGNAAADETESDRVERISEYLNEAIYHARPTGYNDIFDILIDCGRVDDMGNLDLMTGSEDVVDDEASSLCWTYLSLRNDDPGYASVTEIYPMQDSIEDAEADFHDDMRSVVSTWQKQFLERLENDVAERKNTPAAPPASQ